METTSLIQKSCSSYNSFSQKQILMLN